MKLFDFIEDIYRYGLEKFRRYYGPYRANVTSNKDPLHQGRVQVACPRARLPTQNGIWVYPMMYGAGKNKGVFWPPEEGDSVWIFFDNGDPEVPIGYVGGWYGGQPLSEVAAELTPDGTTHQPHKRGFITPGGAKIILDDTSGSEQIRVEHKSGLRVLLTGTKVKVGKKDGSFEPMMRGSTARKWLKTHVHSHPMGPTGPSTTPIPTDILSEDTETS